MKNKIVSLISVLLVATMLLTACGGGGAATDQIEVTFWHAYGTEIGRAHV